jgi:hypothetical protein
MVKYTQRAHGIYRCTFVDVKEVEIPDKETGEMQKRWSWLFQEQGDISSEGSIEQLTGTSLRSANSNAYKLFAGLLGHKPQPDDDTDPLRGTVVDVVYGPNQAGNSAVTSVVRVQDAPTTAATREVAPAATAAPVDAGGAPAEIGDLNF